jgi:replicative DNA helicase
VLEKAEAVEHRDLVVTGVPTGFRGLDSLTAGFAEAGLIVIAARPSMGKTSLALTLAQHAAIEGKAVVGVFSLEMSAEALAMRMLCSEASVDAAKFRTGYLRMKNGHVWEKHWDAFQTRAFLLTTRRPSRF